MIHILGKVTYEDLPKFIGIFSTQGAAMRRQHGSIRSQVFNIPDEENRAIILLEWESRASFEAFLADPAVRETMRSSGTVGRPEFTYLTKIAELPG